VKAARKFDRRSRTGQYRKGVENLDRQIGEGKVYAARFEFGGTGWNELLGSSNPCDYAALRIWTGVAGRLSQKPG